MDQSFDIKIAETPEEINAVMQLRRKVFVEEEGVPEDKEFDRNDFISCTHIYAQEHDKIIGCVRARFSAGIAKLERLCCPKEYRKTPVAAQLMEYAFAFCEYKGYDKVVGYCTKPLLPYWEKSGFHPCTEIPVKKVGNMELYTIQKNITPSPYGVSVSRPETLLNAESDMAQKDFARRKSLKLLQGIQIRNLKSQNS